MARRNKTENFEWHHHKGKGLIISGFVLLLIGVLRLYNFDWPVVLIIVGAVLLVKGFIIKSMKEK